MNHGWTADRLSAFEEKIAALFNEGKIRSPVHLSNGNEAGILKAFEKIESEDWVCCSWRSHYQCLLKGVPEELLLEKIMLGKSISLCFPQYKVISSAIVGGILPIAVGIALGINLRGSHEHVHCFLGDMTAETGAFHECWKFAGAWGLPVRWIIEDNGISVFTPTRAVWKTGTPYCGHLMRFPYKSKWPHSGAGQFVKF